MPPTPVHPPRLIPPESRRPGRGRARAGQLPRLPEVELPLEALLDRVRVPVARIFSDLGIPDQDAEDLLQETLFALIFKWDGIRKPEAWLLATLRNRCEIYRRRLEESLLEAVDPERLEALAGGQAPPQERAELRHDLSVALSHLPERYRDVLHLRYGLGCESSEVAERLGYGSEGLRRLTSRCLVSLGRELESVGVTRENAR